MGFEEACFDDREDELIDQALATAEPVVCGDYAGAAGARGTRSAAAAGGCERRDVAVQHARSGFRTASGRGELLPVPVFAAPAESRAHAAEGALSAGVSAAEGGQLYELDVREYSVCTSGWRRERRACWRCMRPMPRRARLRRAMRWRCSTGAGALCCGALVNATGGGWAWWRRGWIGASWATISRERRERECADVARR